MINFFSDRLLEGGLSLTFRYHSCMIGVCLDVMFERYETIYKQGKYAQVDLFDINKKFLAIFGI